MSMKLVEFDGIALPSFDAEQDQGSAPVDSSVLDSIGGAYDWYGSGTRRARKMQISAGGIMLGETTYLVDEAGNRLVDEAGNALIAGSAARHLRQQLQALRSRTGVRGTLWRQRLEGTTEEWITARLLEVTWPRSVDERTVLANVTCRFESTMTAWRAASATSTSKSVTDGTANALTVPVAGEAIVYDAILTVARTSGTITAVTVTGSGISLTWTGSLASGTLTLDAGAKTARIGSTDSYSGLTFNAGHTARGWLPLQPGTMPLAVTVTGGNATVAVSHYDQWL